MDRKKNRWKYGIWSAFVTILGVLLAVILVWVAERATERFGLKFDLTANDRYAISEQSVSWLKKLDQDVKITVLVNEEDMATGSYYIVQAYQNLLEYEEIQTGLLWNLWILRKIRHLYQVPGSGTGSI